MVMQTVNIEARVAFKDSNIAMAFEPPEAVAEFRGAKVVWKQGFEVLENDVEVRFAV